VKSRLAAARERVGCMEKAPDRTAQSLSMCKAFYTYGIMFFVPLSVGRHLLLAVLLKRAAR